MEQIVNRVTAAMLLVVWPSLSSCSQPAESTPVPTVNDFNIVKKIEWAKPDAQSLTMDIYTPKTGKSSYPVLIIFHGGAWLVNSNSVMDSMSIYIVRHSEYVVCNVNYRLLGDKSNSVTMNQIIEDAMGAVAWIKEFISSYNGDPSKLILTGDSAGGQLAAMVLLSGNRLESDGFAGNSLGYRPTYLPVGTTAEEVARANGLAVQGGILSYPALDIYASCSNGFESQSNFFWSWAGKTARGIFGDSINVNNHPEFYKAVSPVYNIPSVSERSLPPQLCVVGSNDNLVTPASVQSYVSEVKKAGQSAEYWEHAGRPHAFLDSGRNDFLGTEFGKDAPAALDKMIEFMNKCTGN